MKYKNSSSAVQLVVRAAAVPAMAAILAVGLAACGSSCPCEVPIDMSDGSASIFSTRMLARPAGKDDWRPGETVMRDSKSNAGGLEFAYLRGNGQGTQQLGSGDYISNGASTNIYGPQQVQHHAKLNYYHLAYNNVTRYSGANSGLEVEGFIGLGYADVNIRTTAGGPGPTGYTSARSMNTSSSITGVALGVEPRWNFNGHIAVEGRLGLLVSDGSFIDAEFALRYRPIKNLAVSGGYAWLRYRQKDSGNDSGPNVQLSGPFLGLNFLF